MIAESTRFHGKAVVSAFEGLSDTITSYSGSDPSTVWPFMSIPDFNRRGKRALEDAFLEVIGFSPIVTYADRNRWSIYSAYDSEWLLGEPNVTNTVPEHIYRIETIEDDSNAVNSGSEQTQTQASAAAVTMIEDNHVFTAPLWMTSPLPSDASLINYNILSDPTYNYLFHAMMESKHTSLSGVYKNPYLYDKFPSHEHYNLQVVTVTDNGDDKSGEDKGDEPKTTDVTEDDSASLPHSVLMAPVYDSFDAQNRSLVGIIHGMLPWDSYFTDLLPPGVNGIVVVLKNTCGQFLSFEINGPKATFLGIGDLHDPKYGDEMAVEVNFGSDFLGEVTRTYRQCFYSLVIYPSEEFEKKFDSNNTVIFTGLLAIVFVCLALFFFIFVWFVQRRQQRVMGVATRTTAIISNLFPDNVRDRIMKQAEEQANRELKGDEGSENSSQLRGMLLDDNNINNNKAADASGRGRLSSRSTGGIRVRMDAPIADLYPNCTVYFAVSPVWLELFYCYTVSGIYISHIPLYFLTTTGHCWFYSMVQRTRACASICAVRNPLR